ncbi:hypothetical protein E4T49_00834 [Aureobasidium sp. EXF-10728]|nr:hypothetical protein E4T49_00834 [Aureobasidium sp. EXF-10728]
MLPSNSNSLFARLPNEIRQEVANYAAISWATMAKPMNIDASRDPSIPPADGSSPFLGLPCELRRSIFAYILPRKNKVIEPRHQTNVQSETAAAVAVAPVAPVVPVVPVAPAAPAALSTYQSRIGARLAAIKRKRSKAKEAKKKSVPTVGDVLILCKQIAAEVLITLYEERTFAVNVYEGTSDGGIEFLDSGRQRLQYREHFTQLSFKRFEGPEDPFGFSRIKRLLIRVYPATEAASRHENSRHDALHTHFMIRALVNLLKHDGKFGLNRLQVRFVEPRSILWRPHPWQNTSDFSLRSSFIHGIPAVEVILRGLFELRQVHTAVCELPSSLYRAQALSDFVDRLQNTMAGKLPPSTMDDEIAAKIEGARDMLDDWIHTTMFGTDASKAMPTALEDFDFDDVQEVDNFDSCTDEDNFSELRGPSSHTTEGFSAGDCSPRLRDSYEERVTTNDIKADENHDTEPHVAANNRLSQLSRSNPNNDRPARTLSKRRSVRISPLDSSSRESSGGASLLGMISIDDDTWPNWGSLVDANDASAEHRMALSPGQHAGNHGTVARPETQQFTILEENENGEFELKSYSPA